MFEQALEELDAPESAPEEAFLESLNKSQLAALTDFMKALEQRKRTRTSKAKTAYERQTVKCPAEGCKNQITLRTSAINKMWFVCQEHEEEMTVTT